MLDGKEVAEIYADMSAELDTTRKTISEHQ
jgi:hypothetical protein